MHFSELMAVISTHAIRLQQEDEDLVILGSDDALDDALWDSLAEHKSQLLALVASHGGDWLSPAFRITPDMLPLVQLDQSTIDRIVASVPGGAANLQDIYPLAPLQEGMLYLHLSTTAGDPHVPQARFAFDSRERLEAFAEALQWMIERHDILRTSFIWERLDEPLQVVQRHASLQCEEIELSADGDLMNQLLERHDPRFFRLDVQQAPLLRLVFAADPDNDRVVALLLFHHLIMDHVALDVVRRETRAFLLGQEAQVGPAVPYRDHLVKARMSLDATSHEAFFREMLADIDEPTLPCGVQVMQDDGDAEEASLTIDSDLADQLRTQARRLGVSAASLMHVALARVLGQLSGRTAVVFGTVLLGRMEAGEGGEQALGMFINTLPLRVDVGGEGAQAAVLATHRQLTAMLAHEQTSLAVAQRCSAVAVPTPLFSAILNYRHSTAEDVAEISDFAPGIQVMGASGGTSYPLTVNIDDIGKDLRLTVLADAALGAERIVHYLHTALHSLTQALQSTPNAPLHSLNILPADEREYLLHGVNSPLPRFPDTPLIHQQFEAHAQARPDAVALLFEGRTVSYGELNRRANQVAHQLLARGIRPDDRVAICVERGPQMIIGLLGVLKAGAGYVPIDPAYPLERIAYTLEDSAPVALLIQAQTVDRVGAPDVPIIDLDGEQLQAELTSNPQIPELTPSHLAYVIYTSGSTGLPKGVMVEHRNVVRLFSATHDWFNFNPQDVWALFHSFAFDFSVWEIWGALAFGGQLLLVPQAVSRSPDDCYALLCRSGVTVLNQTPSAFRQLIAAQGRSPLQHSLREVIFGGEALEPGLLKPWYARVGNAGTRLVNMYGITETTVHVTYRPLAAADAQRVGRSPIGVGIPDLQLYVLDTQREPVPAGVVGELYVGGAGVARGYLNREALTAERFIADPFSGRAEARLYKTGDLARWTADGSLEYLGRNDDQVKIRGFRIELGEIEARLAACDGVREAVVIACEDSPGDQRLVAYWLAVEGAEPSAAQLREQLLVSLAEYMVPSAFVRLDAYPLTTNGKLDRKALPQPDSDAFARRGFEAPIGAVETLIADIWQTLLGVEQIGRHDNFFELGGHSLLAVKLIERMRQHELHCDVRVLFGQPSVAALAATLGAAQAIVVPDNLIEPGCARITPDMLPLAALDQAGIDRVIATVPGGIANVQDIYGLAPLQAGILYHHLATHAGDPYVLQAQFAFDGLPQIKAFVRAMNAVIARHDILRSSVVWEGLEEPVQVVWRQAPLALERVDAELLEGDVLKQMQARFDPLHYRLDLNRAPLMRFAYTEDVPHQRWVAILLFHHIVLDHTALEMLVAEIDEAMRGQSSDLSAPVQYRQYVAQARLGADAEAHEAFFRDMLGDIDEPTVAFGLQDVHGDGSTIVDTELMLDAGVAERLREQARRLGISVASLVHQAWGQVLGQLSGRDDVVFGTVLLGRMQGGAGADRALGMFINTLPLRVGVATGTVQEGVRATHERLAQLLGHEQASLALAQRCSGVAASLPLFSTLLNYRHSTADSASVAWDGVQLLSSRERSNYPLVVSVDDLGQEFRLSVQAVPQVDGARVCDYLQTALHNLVTALEHTPTVPLQHLSIVSPGERQRVLVGFNISGREYPVAQTVQRLFEAQVVMRPEALALVQGDLELSYGELNQRANRLAHHLIGLGVQADDRVAVCLRRGPEMLVALLAVLKSGAGYVPIDPDYPAERITYLIQDSDPIAVLAQASTQDLLGAVPVINLDASDWQHLPDTNPQLARLTPANLAYVIYTSGSTGQPKGVMVEHRTLENLVHWHAEAFDLHAGSHTASVAGCGFDAMAWEVWPALSVGATVYLPPPSIRNEHLDELLEWWRAQPLQVSFLPTPVAEYAFSRGLGHPTLRTLLIGGDKLRQFPREQTFAVINNYGPTEATVVATSGLIEPGRILHIGRPIANARIYLLDRQQQPVPAGVQGELYVGGAGVARGYLNRPELTAAHFLDDPFSDDPHARMYRTGDLARWLADGNIEYLGRNDDQVKLRGVRIELGEIEAALSTHPGVQDCVVLVRDGRLVAWFTEVASVETGDLHHHLQSRLPDTLVPAAYVRLHSLPLTAHGKLDRKALPEPDQQAWLSREYEAPQGAVEIALAQIWADVLKIEHIGRHDNFFELGGHSLLAVSLIERMRQIGLSADVRVLFNQPSLAALARALGSGREIEVPANLIAPGCTHITPDMLTLTTLDQASIERIVATVPGGAANVQDIYPLAPLQEGILYHHLSAEQGDPYLLQSRLAFDNLERLQTFAEHLQQVIARHDILRTSVVWEGLPSPQQVVWRQAQLVVQHVPLAAQDGDILAQLHERFDARHYRLDLNQAPLIRMVYAEDPLQQQVVAIVLFHHSILDHTAMDVIGREMHALMFDQFDTLTPPMPYRNYVAQARLGADEQAHEAFFREMLGDIDEPTLPFGLQDVQGDGRGIEEALQPVDAGLNLRLREQVRQQGVSPASLMHLAWAQVLGVLSGRRDVVFGTVLMGRMQGGEGADRTLGVFINTLPLRVDLGESVRAGVQTTHARLTALLGHEHASLALAQRCSAMAGSAPLFSALLNYRHSAVEQQPRDGQGIWHGVRMLGGEERSNYPLTLSVDDLGEGFALDVLAVAEIGAQRICSYMHTALEHLVTALEQAPQRPLNRLPILSVTQYEHLLVGFNQHSAAYPRGATIHLLVEAQAEQQPDAMAVVQGAQQLTYAQLNQRANRLAHHLLGLGVQPDDRIAVCLRRSPDMLVALLAILKAGAGYVPVDPAYPAQRIAYLLQDSDPVAVLAQASTRDLLGRMPVIDLDNATWQHLSEANPQLPTLTPAHLAYVIYTSGSTGEPKGVMVEHATLENLVHWHCEAFDLQAGSHTASVAGFGFDAMAWEIWPALCVGATLHLPPQSISNEHLDDLLDWWRAQPLQVSFLPTPVAEYAFSRDLGHPTLRTLLIGGDKLRQLPRNQTFAVINNYGPTEATVVATSGAVEAGQTLHIGRPMANAKVYLLDEQQRPVPVGVAGELFVGGAGVARGYLNRPELSAERFLEDPFSDEPQARMYRTGDLARWLADGTIEYLGRNDDQVKLRGVRIELGEIEAALSRHDAVHDCVVLVRDGQLLAWFTGQLSVEIEDLRSHLQAQLPPALVPAAYVRLDSLPLTANGKLDRKALPEPDQNAWLSHEYEAPQGAVETTLAQIWSEVLQVEQVGRYDNFFELGGHSLMAVTLIERMRQADLRTDVRVLFSQPTLAALAAAVGSGREVEVPANLIPADCTHITPDMLPLVQLDQASIERIVATVPGGAANVQDIYPLAPLQEGILYHYITAERGDPYLLQSRLAFDSLERLQAYADALRQVMARHDILRTGVVWEGLTAPVQVVWRATELPVQEIALDPTAGDVLLQLYERFDARHLRLDISQAPLTRLVYAQDPVNDRVVAMLLFHHIVMDHTALEVVQQEMLAILLGHGEAPMPAVPYRNYVAQARMGISQQEHEAFFREMLGAIDEPTLPFGMLDVRGDGNDIEEVRQSVPEALAMRLRSQARQLGVSVASLFHLAWAQVLAATSGQERVVFGTVLLGRMQGGTGADRGLGMFINTLPIRVDLGETPVRAGVRATHAQLTALLGHEHAPLALAQRCSGVTGSSPLFSAMLNYRHSVSEQQQQAARLSWQGIDSLSSEERTNYPLSLNVDDLGQGFYLTVMTPSNIGATRVCGYMQRALSSLAEALEQTPQAPLNRLPVLPEAERQKLLCEFNATEVDYDLEQTLHGLFEAQVQRTPQAPAVATAAQQLSYTELNARANQLARHLRGLGVQADSRVAICVERSLDMVVGLLAILKAGGGYVPLDPAYPLERLACMLQDSAPVAVLVQGSTRALLGEVDVPVIDLDQPHWQAQPTDNLPGAGSTPQHTAYVIYTSGSTGQPKGVVNEHAAVVNRLLWMQDAYPLTAADTVLQKTPFSFDVSVWEFFWPLMTGARLVMAQPGGHKDPQYLAKVIEAENITTLHFVPSMLDVFLANSDTARSRGLRRVMCSGEALPGSLVRRFKLQLPGSELHNLYGPTEAAVDVTAWNCAGPIEHTPDNTPIGKPIANTRMYILDAQQQPVPQGVIGELYIGGVQVARGYLNRPQLNAERFLDDPFRPDGRMYRTGDVARYLPDGNIEYLGRNDDQVKIRGLRIELGEIQARMTAIAGVQEAAVLAREEVPGDKRLVAYYTGERLEIDVLREHLLEHLPDYMVPAVFVHLHALPLSPNGKLDRKALPAPDQSALKTREYEAPVGEVEIILARLWAELLNVERVGRHDHFFELGGHSLLAVSLIGRLRQEGMEADVRALFEQPTLAGYAAITERMEIVL
ncbi:arthrofactin-type cyclic lipopeptide synthetase B [Pseudomonas baetica]|uniref:Arthrofactin-type cyclic lipopeptide synthetase B n=1 Tax=Pseudomonas baetica TaxID=674054 RepID=A0ABX4Q894_9PSED|nr:non-ribosomal peptide synthetase [Pseudomonas baetica]PKA73027.1 arthrofactin-type cyclic lipopeptide synthetase B [Pseudomonas baetica]PTC19171.1 non-ribosomal peptide synthetase [Pseudomonas baetica]